MITQIKVGKKADPSYGAAFKVLRERRGTALEKAAAGVCSTATVSNFENGKSIVGSSTLYLLLRNLNISPLEYQDEHNRLSSRKYIMLYSTEIGEAYLFGDVSRLQALLEQITREIEEDPEVLTYKIDKCHTEAVICLMDHSRSIPKQDRDLLADYLGNLRSWLYSDVLLFGHCTEVFTLSELASLYSKMKKGVEGQLSRPTVMRAYLEAVGNTIDSFLNRNMPGFVPEIVSDVKSMIMHDYHLNEKLVLIFNLAKALYLEGDDSAREMMVRCQEIFFKSGGQGISRMIQAELDGLSKAHEQANECQEENLKKNEFNMPSPLSSLIKKLDEEQSSQFSHSGTQSQRMLALTLDGGADEPFDKTFGRAFQKVRKARKITQEQATRNVCSANHLSNFEIGEVDLGCDLLFGVLRNINVTSLELDDAYDRERQAQGYPIYNLIMPVDLLYREEQELDTMLDHIKTLPPVVPGKLRLTLDRCRLEVAIERLNPFRRVPEVDVHLLTNYLTHLEDWWLYDISLFGHTASTLDNLTLEHLYDQMISSVIKHNKLHFVRRAFIQTLLNILKICLEREAYPLADKIFDYLGSMRIHEYYTYENLLLHYETLKRDYLLTRDPIRLAKLEQYPEDLIFGWCEVTAGGIRRELSKL